MRARALACLLVAGLALTACSGDGDGAAATLPPITPTPPASPSASPTVAADVPEEAQAATPEGAAAFARYYAQEVYKAYRAKDPERVRRLSTPDCETCNRYIKTIEALIEDNATIEDAYTVEVVDAISPVAEPGATRANVTLILRLGEFVVTGPSGEELAREPADDQLVQDVELVRFGRMWQVSNVTTSS